MEKFLRSVRSLATTRLTNKYLAYHRRACVPCYSCANSTFLHSARTDDTIRCFNVLEENAHPVLCPWCSRCYVYILSYKVKSRAEKAGSSSMVYLVNTLREVIKAAHCLLAEYASSPTTKDDEGVSAAVVVEHYPSAAINSRAILRVRLAVPSDGAVAPSL